MSISCQINHECQGTMICSHCRLNVSTDEECECVTFTSCNQCQHKICNWCSGTTLSRSDECDECSHWDYVGDVCESDFCVDYLQGKGIIMNNLKCNICHSQPALIRVPLAFPLSLDQLVQEYPKFLLIKELFLKYYAYSHTNGIWEPYPASEFRLAQEYFDFDAGIIVLGRSRDDENKAKNKDAMKIEKELRKQLKKERRLQRINEKDDKTNTILSI
jgi:hypothetical protein